MFCCNNVIIYVIFNEFEHVIWVYLPHPLSINVMYRKNVVINGICSCFLHRKYGFLTF